MPDTLEGLLVLLVAVLPGALYTWSFEREAGRWGIGLSDRILRFTGASVVFQLVFFYPLYAVWSSVLHDQVRVGDRTVYVNHLSKGDGLPFWAFLVLLGYIAIPIGLGALAGVSVRRRNASRRWRRLARVLAGKDPAPRAWDFLFSDGPAAVVRLKLKSGARLGGLFADRSYAAGYPEEPQDIYLERVYEIDQVSGRFIIRRPGGGFVETDSSVLIDWADVEFLEVFLDIEEDVAWLRSTPAEQNVEDTAVRP